MWLQIKLFGFEILTIGVGIIGDDDADQPFISVTGGSFELATDAGAEEDEWEYEEEYDPEYDNRAKRPPFGFLHA
jgi:hypothetical protein